MSFHRSNSMGPALFYCPITHDIMENPVILMGDGQTYEQYAVESWLADHNTSPSTGADLDTKAFHTNWALKRIIQEWQRNHASEQLRASQLIRLENFLLPDGPYKDAFDVEVLVGEEKQKFLCVRGMLGVFAPFFRELMCSESGKQQKVFELPQVTAAGFETVLRESYNLDPNIDASNVMDVLKASAVFNIPKLRDEALAHLSMNISQPAVAEAVTAALEGKDRGIELDDSLRSEFIGMLLNRSLDGDNVMTVFSAALSLGMLTPELETKCCKIFVTQGNDVVRSTAFAFTRYELLLELIQNDNFYVTEENLWFGVCNWCKQQALFEAQDPNYSLPDDDTKEEFAYTPGSELELNGLLGLGIMEDKYQLKYMNQRNDFPEAAMKYLKRLLPYFRFPLMDVGYFSEHVAPLLPRHMSDNVLVTQICGGDSLFSAMPRNDPNSRAGGFTIVHSNANMDAAVKIPDPDQDAQWSGQKLNQIGNQYFIVDCQRNVQLVTGQWKNRYSDGDTIKTVELFLLPEGTPYSSEIADKSSEDDSPWVKMQELDLAQVTEWQRIQFLPKDDMYARYYKFLVRDLFGSEDNYTCLNHLKLETRTAPWKTNFANKFPDV